MSTETEVHESAVHDAHGPSDAQYIKVAVFLAVVTAIEVGLYYTDFGVGLTNTALLVLALLKFVTVVAYFMHLKFENPILRRVFTAGFLLAMFCYFPVLLMFHIFIS